MHNEPPLPRLRPLAITRVRHNGQVFFYLQDPLKLSEQTLLVPEPLGPLLLLLDGSRPLARVQAELAVRFGLEVNSEHITGLLDALSQAYLLDDEAYHAAMEAARTAYRTAPCRPPALTNGVYPASPAALTARLYGYERDAGAVEGSFGVLAGLITPHIDYHRGWRTYAHLWRRAAPAVREAEVVVIFGTDHHGSPGTLTLSRQAYATPWGAFNVDHGAIDAMAAALGEDAAFAEELHHRDEHSIELAAVWLHHIREGKPCTVIPVLCGHPLPWLEGCDNLDTCEEWGRVSRSLAALREQIAGRRVLAVAAADLAHVGPAFGDPEPFSGAAKQRVQTEDDALLAACSDGPAAVLRTVKAIDDRFRICGLSPIALTLAFTGPVQAEVTGYDQCPADHDGGDGSIVSIAGVLLHAP